MRPDDWLGSESESDDARNAGAEDGSEVDLGIVSQLGLSNSARRVERAAEV